MFNKLANRIKNIWIEYFTEKSVDELISMIQQNEIKINNINKTKLKGVLYHNGGYYARINIFKKQIYGTKCNTAEEAERQRIAMKKVIDFLIIN